MRHRPWTLLGLTLTLAACTQSPPPVTPGDDSSATPGNDAAITADASIATDAGRDVALMDSGMTPGEDAGQTDSGLDPLDVPPTPTDTGTMVEAPPTCVGDDATPRSAHGLSRFPSVTWTGTEFGIAWQDDFVEEGGPFPDGPFNIHFARVSATGEVLAEGPLTSDNTGTGAANEYPSLAWGDGRYWIAYAHTPRTPAPASIRVIAVRPVGTDGMEAAAPVTVSTPADGSTLPWIASSGSGLVIAWEDGRHGTNDHEIYARSLSSAGVLGTEVRVTNAPRFSGRPVLAWNAGAREFGVLFQDDRDGSGGSVNEELYFARLTPGGERVAGAQDVRVTSDMYRSIWHSMASDGTGYGIAWVNENDRPDEPTAYFARLDAAGARPGSSGDLRLSSAPLTNREYSTSVGWNGAEYLVVFQDNRHLNGDLNVRHVSASGALLGGEFLFNDDLTVSDHPSIAWGNNRWFVAWEDTRDTHMDIYFRTLARDACLAPTP